ncbi:MAG: hypothetical protein AAF604_02015 [Acidobacteriota bacterium]
MTFIHTPPSVLPRIDPPIPGVSSDSTASRRTRGRWLTTLLFAGLALLVAAEPMWAATITVNSSLDNETQGDGVCTLREALNNANANNNTTSGDCTTGSGTDTIAFNIPGTAPVEIELVDQLIVTDPVVLDGTTQPGNSGACTMPIPDRPTYTLSILGDLLTGAGANTAFRFSDGSDGSTVKGLNLQGFNFRTIIVQSGNHTFECNFVGTNADGSSATQGTNRGFDLQAAAGGSTIRTSLISGNGNGIRVGSVIGSISILDNFIGTNRAGTGAVPNNIGVSISGNHEVGRSGNGNLISGNANRGVSIGGTGTRVDANLIGTDVSGTFAVPNGVGIFIAGDDNDIGRSGRNVISGNTGVGVSVDGDDNEVVSNYIGTDISGTFAVSNGSHGVTVTGADNSIGFGGCNNGNLISGNVGDGVLISGHEADNTDVHCNSIGTNADETAAVPNGGNGITIFNDDGGSTELLNVGVGFRRNTFSNVIGGNVGHGIHVTDENNNLRTRVFILGNFIGTDRTETVDLGNGLDGINFGNNIENSRIGQFQSDGPTLANTIAFNDGNGVNIVGGTSQGNRIDQNFIFENDGLGIDLADDGVTPNDNNDGDGGPNRRQNFPDLVSASLDCSDQLTVEYSLSSSQATGSNTHVLEFFLADADAEEGAVSLGRANYTFFPNVRSTVLGTGADLGVTFGDPLVATAQSNLGDTSEFSPAIAVSSSCAFEVTNTNDAGAGSLRQAILDSNPQSVPTMITFDIAGSGPHVISPLSALPPITGVTAIDGATQPGAETVCSTDLASRPDYQIVIDGAAGGRPDLLTLVAGSEGSTIQGLNLRNGNAAIVALSADHTIRCNGIGTDETGMLAMSNTVGVSLASAGNTVGGLLAVDANEIAFNVTGILAASGVANNLRGNSFFQNTGLAIDLGADGATANDAADADLGANLLQNAPALVGALIVDTEAQITYTVDSDPSNQAYPIAVDFYTPDADVEEGQTLLFSDVFEAGDHPGDVVVSVTASTFGLGAGDRVVALATDANGNTSEFSTSVALMAPGCLNVTTTADSGTGSLREAVTCANATPEHDTITFAIPGTGPHEIALSTALPTITAPVTIDGTTQSGNGTVCTTAIPDRPTYQVIVSSTGFRLGAGSDGSTIRGLNVRGFSGRLIHVDGSANHVVACNFLGTNETGMSRVGVNGEVRIEAGNNVTVGGADATQGNLIVASPLSNVAGVRFINGGSGNRLQHNFIGTDKTGTAALPNDFGVVVSSFSGTQEDLAILDNLISGNAAIGVIVDDVDGLEMKRNLIGTDLTGTQPLANGDQGIAAGFTRTADGITIGGTDVGDGNTIAFNGAQGVTVGQSSRVALLGNHIFSNTQLGIDLGAGGGTNDAGDPDTGNNQLQNFPVLTGTPIIDGGTLEISYAVDATTTNAAYPLRVEFFMADGDGQEGMTYLGFDAYTASDYAGCGAAPCTKAASIALGGDVADGDTVLATATDANGNTSQFSSTTTAAAGCLTVTTAADTGLGSLREAITCANTQAGLDTITFAIPGAGPHVITLASNLPDIVDPVIIDGASQPGSEGVCKQAIPDRPPYGIVIDGNGVASRGLQLFSNSGGSTIRGLNIRGANTAISVTGAGASLQSIQCNFIGTDETGLAAAANVLGIFIGSVANVTVGGSDQGDGNLISGNTGDGLALRGVNALDETIQGNFIGTDKTGLAPLGNGGAGVLLDFQAGTATVGGTGEREGNVIAYNDVGVLDQSVTVGHTIRGNRIFANTGLGIDLGNDGVTANDADDADTGTNQLQNTPQILSATTMSGVLEIAYLVDSATANSAYPLTVDLYVADGDGEEGAVYVGSKTYGTADAQSPVVVTFTNPGLVATGDVLVATATDANGNTSEFSASVGVDAYVVTTTADSGVGSLRQAILNANSASGLSWLTFHIAGEGPHVIAPASNLPAIQQPLIVDGASQAGNETVCTDAIADRGAYQIVLEGDIGGAGLVLNGLELREGASGSILQGLNVRNFVDFGIFLNQSDSNIVRCNVIGTDETGAMATGNGMGILDFFGEDNRIGGPDDGDGNLMSGNTAGTQGFPGAGIFLANSQRPIIQGNLIGTDKGGTEDLGNTIGVNISPIGFVTDPLIGGSEEGEGNTFAFNDTGIIVPEDSDGVAIRGNAFFANDTLAIDLEVGGTSGRTPNDAGDVDDTANRGQNFPVLTTVDGATGDLLVTFQVDTPPAQATYPLTVELFVADEANAQGALPLGMAEYSVDDYGDCGAAPCPKTVNLGAITTLGLAAGQQVVSTATDDEGNTSEFSDGATVAGLVDLAVSIAESIDPVVAGSGVGNLVYTVTVTNEAPVNATGVVLDNTLTLPLGVTVVSQVPSAGSFSGTTWSLGPLGAGASETLAVTLTAAASAAAGVDTIADTVTVTAVDGTDTDASNDTASESTSIARSVDLGVSVVESVDPAVAGSGMGNLIYTVTASNGGPSDATGVVLENVLTLPTGVTVVSQVPSAGSLSGTTWTLGSLPSGGSAMLTVTLTVDASAAAGTDVITNAATVAAVTETDANSANDAASESTSITRQLDLAVSVAESIDPAVAGAGVGNLVYTVLVTNNGLIDATGVVLENVLTLPAGVAADSQVPTIGTFSGTTWTLGTLASSASATLTVTLTVDSSAAVGTDVIANAAAITAVNEADSDTSNDTASESTSIGRGVDVSVSVGESIDPVVAGSGVGNLVYTVTVTNDGRSDATGVTLSNSLTLPTGVAADSEVPSAGTFSGTTWTLGTLAAGTSETLTVTLTADASAAAGTDVITNAATITAVNEGDSDTSNDTASESTSIVRELDLAVSLVEAGGLSAVLPGGTLTYEVTASNVGPSDATGVVLNGTVPDHTSFDSAASDAGWQCVPDATAGSACTLDVGDLASGDTSPVAFVVLVDASLSRDVTEITNEASITTNSGEVDVNPADNTDALATPVDLPPIVEGVDTVAMPLAEGLVDGDLVEVPITQILLAFSESVTGGAAADSFRLFEAGADGVVSSSCLGLQGDDQEITIVSTVYDDAVLYDTPTSRLELGAGLPLQKGRYRVLACGDEIEDAAGQLLDGDVDGVAGGDFGVGFSVRASSLLENPNFDQALAPWSSLDFDWSDEDADGAPSSGATAAMPVTEAVLDHPCIEVDASQVGLVSSMLVWIDDPTGASPAVVLELDFFDESGCQGTLVTSQAMSSVEGGTGMAWLESKASVELPENVVSARPRLRYRTTDAASSVALVDRITLIPSLVFADGFESGDTSAWSVTVP